MKPTAALLIRGNPAGNRAEKTGQQKTADKKTGRQLTPNHHRRLGELTSGFRSSQPDGRRIFTSQAREAVGSCDLTVLVVAVAVPGRDCRFGGLSRRSRHFVFRCRPDRERRKRRSSHPPLGSGKPRVIRGLSPDRGRLVPAPASPPEQRSAFQLAPAVAV